MNLTAHDYVLVGIYVATLLYVRRDVNGIGAKTRKMIAEMILQAAFIAFGKVDEGFETTVRRLLG